MSKYDKRENWWAYHNKNKVRIIQTAIMHSLPSAHDGGAAHPLSYLTLCGEDISELSIMLTHKLPIQEFFGIEIGKKEFKKAKKLRKSQYCLEIQSKIHLYRTNILTALNTNPKGKPEGNYRYITEKNQAIPAASLMRKEGIDVANLDFCSGFNSTVEASIQSILRLQKYELQRPFQRGNPFLLFLTVTPQRGVGPGVIKTAYGLSKLKVPENHNPGLDIPESYQEFQLGVLQYIRSNAQMQGLAVKQVMCFIYSDNTENDKSGQVMMTFGFEITPQTAETNNREEIEEIFPIHSLCKKHAHLPEPTWYKNYQAIAEDTANPEGSDHPNAEIIDEPMILKFLSPDPESQTIQNREICAGEITKWERVQTPYTNNRDQIIEEKDTQIREAYTQEKTREEAANKLKMPFNTFESGVSRYNERAKKTGAPLLEGLPRTKKTYQKRQLSEIARDVEFIPLPVAQPLTSSGNSRAVARSVHDLLN